MEYKKGDKIVMGKLTSKKEFDDSVYDVLLTKFKDELKAELKGYYVWDFDELTLDGVAASDFIEDIQKIKKYEDKEKEKEIPKKTIKIKKELKNHINDDEKFKKWIVTKWGGINNLPSNLMEKEIDDNLDFDSISSFSKVASFIDCEKYAVYDSRVAFTLNWLIFINHWHEKDGGKMKFFRQPDGRNGKMQKHNQETIFNIKYENYDENDEFYYKKRETYHKYCKLLRETCAFGKSSFKYKSFKDNISVGALEMCLFSIAAKDSRKGSIKTKYEDEGGFITDDMDNRIKIEILCN